MSENYGLPPKDPALIEIKRLRAERDALRRTLNDHLESEAAESMRADKLRAERDALRDEVGLRRHTMPAQYAKLIAERDTLQKERDHALEMVNVQDNQIDALRALLKVAQDCIYSLDAREIYADELARIDAALAGEKNNGAS